MDYKGTITITFGDQAENHVGMQKIGRLASEGDGFSREDLAAAEEWFKRSGPDGKRSGPDGKRSGTMDVRIYTLNDALPLPTVESAEKAYLLVAKNGVAAIENPDELYAELAALEWDAKAFMYGRVVNKVARHNLCFAEAGQEPDYEKGMGRIVAYDKVPRLSNVQTSLESVVGPRGAGLCAEGNYYYDSSKCGIGFHGDSERRRVVALRLGASVPLHFQWFKGGQPVGERFEVPLSHGDIYMMSEKAVGTDWKCRSRYTLRHAAGAHKFLKV